MTTLSTALLGDDDFAELMGAEYAARGSALDDVTRQRLWKRIEAGLVAPAAAPVVAAPPARLWAGPFAMAMLLLVGLGSFLLKPAADDGQRIKGAEAGLPVTLIAYEMRPDGSLAAYAPQHAGPGTMLVFKTLASRSGVVALAMAEGKEPAVVRFLGSETRAGVEQLLERDGRTYGYKIEAGQTATLRFCALAESSPSRLSQLLARLPDVFRSVGGHACVDVPPGGPAGGP